MNSNFFDRLEANDLTKLLMAMQENTEPAPIVPSTPPASKQTSCSFSSTSVPEQPETSDDCKTDTDFSQLSSEEDYTSPKKEDCLVKVTESPKAENKVTTDKFHCTQLWKKFSKSYQQYFSQFPSDCINYAGLELVVLHQNEPGLSFIEFTDKDVELVNRTLFLPNDVIVDSEQNPVQFDIADNPPWESKKAPVIFAPKCESIVLHHELGNDQTGTSLHEDSGHWCERIQNLESQCRTAEQEINNLKLQVDNLRNKNDNLLQEIKEQESNLAAESQMLQSSRDYAKRLDAQLNNYRENYVVASDHVSREFASLQTILDTVEYKQIPQVELLTQTRVSTLRQQEQQRIEHENRRMREEVELQCHRMLEELEMEKQNALDEFHRRLLKQEESPYICTICYDLDRTHTLVDCGHTFCEVCVGKLDECPICRKVKTTDAKRVYFS